MATIALKEQEIINFRIDKKLKVKAQKYSSQLGISLTTLIKSLITNAIEEKSLVLIPREKTKKRLDDAYARFKKGEYVGPFDNAQDLIKSLRKA